MIKAQLDSIPDRETVDALRAILEQLNKFPFFQGQWRFIEYTTKGAVTNVAIPHTLKFSPKDAILLSASNGVTVTFNYSSFNKTTISFSTTGATTFRAFIGSYKEE